MPQALEVLDKLPIKDITNCCGRKLQGSAPFPGADDPSMDGMTPEKCYFARPRLVGPYVDNGVTTFKRCHQRVLFAPDECGKDMCLDDIIQGQIGDCWFLSAIDFSVNHPLYASKLRDTLSMHGESVRVTLHDIATGPKTAYVDTRVLVNGHIVPAVVSVLSKDPSEVWPAMLEKGLAKMCGGYGAIEGGWMSEGMSMLHGGRGFFVSCHEFVPKMLRTPGFMDAFVRDLNILYDLGYGLFTAWEDELFDADAERPKGLVCGHAYSILGIRRVGDDHVFKLKNPWGKFEWTGELSDADDSDAACAARAAFDMPRRDDGVFLMTAQDLFGRCRGIDIFEPSGQTLISCRHSFD
jgi:hypothetical protein